MGLSKVCFVLGAGASRPYGYPLGGQLKERSIQFCLSNPALSLPPAPLAQTRHELVEFARLFEDDYDSSTIDEFLKKLPKDDVLARRGRMAVVAVLACCEHAFDEEKTGWWYEMILPLLDSKCTIRVVTFNYDRSLEYFLSRAIERRRKLSTAEARKEFSRKIEIEHVYGCIARLPDFPGNTVTAVEYGEVTPRVSSRAGGQIRFIEEGSLAEERPRNAEKWLSESDYIIVLGFGFHQTNLNLIGLQSLPAGKCIFSSGLRLDEKARNQIRWACMPSKIHFAGKNSDIHKFLSDSKLLAFIAEGESDEDTYQRLGPGVE